MLPERVVARQLLDAEEVEGRGIDMAGINRGNEMSSTTCSLRARFLILAPLGNLARFAALMMLVVFGVTASVLTNISVRAKSATNCSGP